MTLELARALREGTTRPCMAALVLASYFQALQLLVAGQILAMPKMVALAYVAPTEVWAGAYIVAGTLMAWRLFDKRPRTVWAWGANSGMSALWLSNYLAPAVVLQDTITLASPLIVLPLGAAWVMMRTQSTARDRAQA